MIGDPPHAKAEKAKGPVLSDRPLLLLVLPPRGQELVANYSQRRIESRPVPPKHWSLPSPPSRASAAAPPLKVSLPAPPFRMSSLSPPCSVSLPPPPDSVSMPALPFKAS